MTNEQIKELIKKEVLETSIDDIEVGYEPTYDVDIIGKIMREKYGLVYDDNLYNLMCEVFDEYDPQKDPAFPQKQTIKVADVEYNDDDGYDVRVLVKIKDTDTDEDVENALTDMGMLYVYVNEIDTITTFKHYNDYEVVKDLGESHISDEIDSKVTFRD